MSAFRDFLAHQITERGGRWGRAVFLGITLYVLWEVLRFVLLMLAPENQPFLLRTVVQTCELLLILALLHRAFRPGKTSADTFERRYLLAVWALFGVWLIVMVPMGFAIRDPYLYGQPNLQSFHGTFSHVGQFRWFLVVVWLTGGLGAALLYSFKKRWADVDEIMLPLVCHLVFTGLVMLVRLGPDRMKTAALGWNQTLFFVIGSLVFAVLICPPFRERLMSFAERYPYIILMVTLALIAGTFLFGTALSGGRKLWYRLGPVTLQPIEISKILFVFVVATFLEKKAHLFQKSNRISSLVSLGALCLSLFVILLLQKDLGPIMVLVMVCMWMFVTVSGRLDILMGAGLGIGGIVTLAFLTRWPSMVYHRIMDFVDPLSYSSQMTYALWTQASGDLWGTAPGLSKAFKVPVIESDYIFTAILAEKGWIGASVLLLAFLALTLRGFQLARFLSVASRRDATYLMGLVMVLFVQQAVIVAGNLNLFPLSGLTLPFVSAGGSSLVVNLGVLGLVMGLVARHTRKATVEERHGVATSQPAQATSSPIPLFPSEIPTESPALKSMSFTSATADPHLKRETWIPTSPTRMP
ncbi:FtsW/RodA/SpoVE family cell cycle protein [Sulfidibacter corallicola]|uniref:FtsW/RodA/SpoVE family cell cycle protein n=1 Tax=Sulfidibacter corallicola TaxID=2818388 RepID=A0A8A4TWR1_SULCO|nr:FtsW/RodA/SpoVE family cell cycle protein [Sulfidibacter corallicola]QTD53923.1 FtsW/RodA/SpoVE family cell cycle protein [Sulfidibacter corallicola]